MKESDKVRLKANHKYLVKNLNVEDIQDFLYEKEVLTLGEFEDLAAERTNTRAARSLLLLLPKKGDSAFEHFLSALEDAAADHIIIQLKETQVNAFKESDYDNALHEEDKIKQLQAQMLVQTEFILDSKKQIDFLKERIKMNEEDSSNLKTKYADLEKTMQEKGLKQGDVVDLIRSYIEAPDVPDIGSTNFSSPLPSPKNPQGRPGSGTRFSFSSEDVNTLTTQSQTPTQIQTDCVIIAREMGRDIVKFVVQKALKKKKKISSPPNKYCAKMRQLVEELYAKWHDLFDRFIIELNMHEMSGLQTFVNVAEEIFKEGENNWGRVVVLYAFAGYVARHCVENDMEKIAVFVGDFLGYYVVHKLGPWITDHGGWDAFLEKFSSTDADPSGSRLSSFLWPAVVGLGVGAVAGIYVTKNT